MWESIAPHLPQPRNDAEVLTSIHCARTYAQSIAFRLRAYSHAWLVERGLPSGLPDYLRPSAERMYPRVVDAVGIAVGAPPHRRELGLAVRHAMSDAVEDCYADGNKDPAFVKARMFEARLKVMRG
jgi:hypothetical protein